MLVAKSKRPHFERRVSELSRGSANFRTGDAPMEKGQQINRKMFFLQKVAEVHFNIYDMDQNK